MRVPTELVPDARPVALMVTPRERAWLARIVEGALERPTPGIPRLWKAGIVDRLREGLPLTAHDTVVGQPPDSPANTP